MNKNVKNVLVLLLMITGIMAAAVFSQDFDIFAGIESVRKDSHITLRFEQKPAEAEYELIESGRVIGTVELFGIEALGSGKARYYRAYGRYTLKDEGDAVLIRAGLEIGLRRPEEKKEREYGEHRRVEAAKYKERITSLKDTRVMVFVPAGKFIFGSDAGDKDESPEQVGDISEFYIDKYEVSNRDYYYFVTSMNARPPQSWKNGMYDDGTDDFPVIVSYYEAEVYAKWAGKRLPTELEWEKAARGAGYEEVIVQKGGLNELGMKRIPLMFPWGSAFDPARANTLEFWSDAGAGAEIKKVYSRGLLPVSFFEGKGDSPCGAVNMAGNASEWTSSWYRPYPGSKYLDRRFGTQFKVMRGGSWMDTAKGVRTTDRHLGGIPNLYKDAAGGFRCVKSPTILDLQNE